jgi:hypothetical protein
MSNRTITKFSAFVISLAAASATFSGCGFLPESNSRASSDTDRRSPDYAAPKEVGRIESDQITESSGIAASQCQPDVFWTHNDSGDGAYVYALDGAGRNLGTWRVTGAENKDWEDIAAFRDAKGVCFLYIGDIGNNELKKNRLTVYRVREPRVSESDRGTTRAEARETESATAIAFRYSDAPHNAETLLVHPKTADIYILTKSKSEASFVHRLRPASDATTLNVTEQIAELSVPAIPDGLLTGGDISPDGKRVAVCDYFSGYELLLPDDADGFDEIWKSKPLAVELGERKIGEAIGYSADGRALFATSEEKNRPMIRVERR